MAVQLHAVRAVVWHALLKVPWLLLLLAAPAWSAECIPFWICGIEGLTAEETACKTLGVATAQPVDCCCFWREALRHSMIGAWTCFCWLVSLLSVSAALPHHG
jgi:hypothetical protein